MSIRELQKNEWFLLKQLRLKALKSDPLSFWENHTEAEKRPEKYWKDLSHNLTKRNGICFYAKQP